MCAPVNRRSFVASIAALVPAATLLRPPVVMAGAGYPTPRRSSPTPAAAPVTYICPPCGQLCDKLAFDKPGSCPVCGMTLIPATGAGVPTVAMLVYPGVEIIDIAGPWEAFGTAGFVNGKIFGWSGQAAYMASKGMTFVTPLLAAALAIEALGSLLLILGFRAHPAAAVMFIYLGIVSVRMHAFWAMTGMAAGQNETHFFKNLGMMGGLLMIAVYGVGTWSIDARATRSNP
jgi:putative oxidoreductase